MVDDIKIPEPNEGSNKNEDDYPDQESSFLPPEEIADSDDIIDMANSDKQHKNVGTENPKNKLAKHPGDKHKIKKFFANIRTWWQAKNKKQKVLILFVILLVLAGIFFGGYKIYKKLTYKSPPAPVQKAEAPKPTPAPTTVASKLTGVQIPVEQDKLSVTGIMIENSPDARPQSGLKDAGVVFEAIAEGGITRFLALFHEAQPDYIGPVRSVRPYYLSWLEGYDAAVAHAGGSPVALAKIKSDGVKDLDQFANSGAYHRVSNRYAPHNLYTSRSALLEAEKSKGFGESNFVGFARKAEKPLATPLTKTIDISISGPLYNNHYDYVAATNSYSRSEGGKPHVDEKSGQQLSPKVVIAMVLNQSPDPDGVHTTYQTIGSGKAYIFQDGNVVIGTWSKAGDKEPLIFGDTNGSPIGLNPGQTWITATGLSTNVSYQP